MTDRSPLTPERAHQLLAIANGLPIDQPGEDERLDRSNTEPAHGFAAFTAAESAYLATQAIGRIATSRNGTPDVAPVRFALAGSRIDISGMDPTRTIKFHNVLANGQASFVVDDMISERPWLPRGVKVTGSATVSGDGTSAIISVTPHTVWSWGINEDAEVYFGPIEKRSIAATNP